MRIRRIFAGLLLSGSFALVIATPANAADVKKSNEEMSKCVAKDIKEQTDASECAKAPSLILPATSEIVWGGGAFLLLLILMYKKAFPMVKKGMDARTEKIRNDLDSADQTKVQADQMLTEYQRQLTDAKAESNRIIEEARTTAEQMRRDLISRAEAEAAQLRERNQTELVGAKDRMIVDLRSEVTGLALELAEKVIGKNLDKETNSKLIDQYISQVGAGK